MEWTAEEILKLQQIMHETDVMSLNATTRASDESGDETEIGEFVENPESMEDDVLKQDALRNLLKYVERLDPREEKIIKMRFGLDTGVPMTLEDIGAKYNVTRERIRQIEANAITHLRHILKMHKLNYNDFI